MHPRWLQSLFKLLNINTTLSNEININWFAFFSSCFQNRYIATSRELTRLQGVTRAPIIDHFTETFLGAPTVRCFRKEDEFYQTNLDRINSNLRMSFNNYAANEWLGFRLELIGTLILSITAFLMISLPSNFIKKGNVVISISCILIKLCGSWGRVELILMSHGKHRCFHETSNWCACYKIFYLFVIVWHRQLTLNGLLGPGLDI